jgi:hypothetical protein
MQKAGNYAGHIQLEIGQQSGNLHRMNDVGLT